MSAHMDNTFGAAFIGMVVATLLCGISCVQAFYYYTNQSDPWYIKHLVTTVMFFNTAHQALITHATYRYAITGNLEQIVWSVPVAIAFMGVTAFIVQNFLTMRIWRLSQNIYLTGIPAILAAAGFLTIIVSVVKSLQLTTTAELAKTKDYTIAITVLSSTTDLLIAATLCALLHTWRTGYPQSEIIINKLIVFTVNTGLITSLCALGALISTLVTHNTWIFVAFFFCIGDLYANTLLATLNTREIIRNADGAGVTDISFKSRDFQSNVLNQAQNISIKIDTSAETYQHPGNDQKPQKNPGLPYDEESTKKVPY